MWKKIVTRKIVIPDEETCMTVVDEIKALEHDDLLKTAILNILLVSIIQASGILTIGQVGRVAKKLNKVLDHVYARMEWEDL